MTGTALTEEEEFSTIYKLDIVEIPTNRPVIRIDNEDAVYKTENGKYRAVIHLFYYEGYQTEEIARILGRSPSTVRAQLTRARQKLRTLLKEDI